MKSADGPMEQDIGSWPLPLPRRNWSGWHAGIVSLSAGVATSSLVVGAFMAHYVNAREGTAAMLAGGLITHFLVTLAQTAPVTKFGIETISTTKPQLGTRGSAFALFVQYVTLIGWNCVLIIFLARSATSILLLTHVIDTQQSDAVSTSCAVGATFLVWIFLLFGAKGLKYVGVVIVTGTIVMGLWMYWVLFSTFGIDAILSARSIDPLPEGRLMNYSVALEIVLVSTFGWWAYVGGMFRLVSNPSRALYPSILSLGLGLTFIGLIGLYSALVIEEPDPTVWIVKIAGPLGAPFVLTFVIISNLGSVLVGAHAAVLGVGQLRIIDGRLSWAKKAFVVLIPMFVIEVFFSAVFYENVGAFLAFIGVFISPLIGIQIVDWFVFDRIHSLHMPSLFRHDACSCYYYTGGFNFAGIGALVLGAATYVALINPITFVPNSYLMQYTTASLPSVLVGGLAYYVGMKWFGVIRPEPTPASPTRWQQR